MRFARKKEVLTEIISGMLVLLFMYAAVSKLLDHENFVIQLSSQLNITFLPQLISYLLPAEEIFFSLLVVFEPTRKIGLYALLTMLTGFSVYIVCMLLGNKKLHCTCGGVISQLTWKEHLILNLFFIGLSIAGIILMNKESKYTENTLLT